MATFQPLATTKALENPLNQRGPQNREAKIWTIYPPDSDEAVVVTNLKHWARENYELFEPGSDDIDATAERICSGFHAIAQTLKGNRGGSGKQRGTTTYKGWSMRTLPEVPKKKGLPRGRPFLLHIFTADGSQVVENGSAGNIQLCCYVIAGQVFHIKKVENLLFTAAQPWVVPHPGQLCRRRFLGAHNQSIPTLPRLNPADPGGPA